MRQRDDEGHRDLVKLVVGSAHDGDLRDQAGFHDHVLDFGRRDVLRADLQHVLGPVGEREVPVGMDGDPVTSAEPAPVVEAVRGLRRLVEVPGEERYAGCSLDEEVAGLLGRNGGYPVVADDRYLVLGGGTAHRHGMVWRVWVPDDRVRDGLGHAPPADRLDTQHAVKGSVAYASAE